VRHWQNDASLTPSRMLRRTNVPTAHEHFPWSFKAHLLVPL
jgi:hypothetical protein